MQPRLKDIAEELGLSVTTVSRALAGYSDVAEQTRLRVLETASRLGYVPNVIAQQLQQKRTNVIGFIIPTFGPRFSDPFFSELIAGIGNEAARQGYDVLMATVAPGPDEIDTYRRHVLSGRVDGVLLPRTRLDDQRISFLLEVGFPFVAFGRTELDLDFPWIDVDGIHGLELAVDHLASLGHRQIAYLRAPDILMFDAMRWQGFQNAMARHGLPIQEKWILRSELTQRSGYEFASRLLKSDDRPTAIVTGNDLMALGAMAAAQSLGLEVGRDISIIGFDDIPPAEHAHPPLTTIHQPIYRIATTVTDMLIRLLTNRPLEQRQILMDPKLVVRQSTGPMP